jgi:D-alanine-D-alanine ligase
MLSRDKVLTKQILAWHRIPTPDFRLFPVGHRFREPRRINFPLFVKSATEDASLGIAQASVVEDMGSLRERVEFIHQYLETDALVEEYVEGRELYVGVMGNSRLTTFPVWEMHFGTMPETQARIATRKVKWDRKYQAKHDISTAKAQDLSSSQLEHIGRLAKRIYRALHMSGFARMDFRMGAGGKVLLLEANGNPDLSYGEDFAESGAAMGLNYNKLLSRIINLGKSYSPEWRTLQS